MVFGCIWYIASTHQLDCLCESREVCTLTKGIVHLDKIQCMLGFGFMGHLGPKLDEGNKCRKKPWLQCTTSGLVVKLRWFPATLCLNQPNRPSLWIQEVLHYDPCLEPFALPRPHVSQHTPATDGPWWASLSFEAKLQARTIQIHPNSTKTRIEQNHQ